VVLIGWAAVMAAGPSLSTPGAGPVMAARASRSQITTSGLCVRSLPVARRWGRSFLPSIWSWGA
jgi:hypothetical protein